MCEVHVHVQDFIHHMFSSGVLTAAFDCILQKLE